MKKMKAFKGPLQKAAKRLTKALGDDGDDDDQPQSTKASPPPPPSVPPPPLPPRIPGTTSSKGQYPIIRSYTYS